MTIDADGGTGSLAICGKIKYNVKNWLENTDPICWDEVSQSQHDYPFNAGPFGEAFANNTRCFKGSVCHGLHVDAASDLQPLEGEAYLGIDHTLPMSGYAQGLLAKRLRTTFEIQTAFVP